VTDPTPRPETESGDFVPARPPASAKAAGNGAGPVQSRPRGGAGRLVRSASTRLTVLSGPSAVGKSTVIETIRRRNPEVWLSISVTTRAPRPGEVHGREYFFVTEHEFNEMADNGQLLEWARYAGNFYGTPKAPVAERLAVGLPSLLEVDVVGARQVRAAVPGALLVFLAPPSWDELVRRLTVLSGPSAVGKSTVIETIRRRNPEVWLSISVTTRAPRPGEVHGREYFFITEDEFKEMAASGQLLEWARYAGNYYGTPRTPVADRLAVGLPGLLEVDVVGARQVRAAVSGALLVFLAPPSWDELVRRLTERGTESAEVISKRLAAAKDELRAEHEFDITLVNTSVLDVCEQLVALMTAQPVRLPARVSSRTVSLGCTVVGMHGVVGILGKQSEG